MDKNCKICKGLAQLVKDQAETIQKLMEDRVEMTDIIADTLTAVHGQDCAGCRRSIVSVVGARMDSLTGTTEQNS